MSEIIKTNTEYSKWIKEVSLRFRNSQIKAACNNSSIVQIKAIRNHQILAIHSKEGKEGHSRRRRIDSASIVHCNAKRYQYGNRSRYQHYQRKTARWLTIIAFGALQKSDIVKNISQRGWYEA